MIVRHLLALLMFTLGQSGQAAEPVPENLMKATYLYNFAVFTEWPAHTGDTFNLCVLGQDTYGLALDSIEGKKVNGQRILVTRLSNLSAIRSCQLLFVSEQQMPNMKHILDTLNNAPVLTVTDTATSSQSGAMIALSLEDRHLTFEVNLEQVRRSQLTISSKMLQLAKKTR